MKKLLATTGALLTSLGIAGQAFAADLNLNPCPKGSFSTLCNNTDNPNAIMGNIFTLILVVVVLVALAFLIWGGIKWIMSGGDKSKVETARNTIIGAIIGLIVAFLAYFIISLVASLFGVTLFGGGSDATRVGLPNIFSGSTDTSRQSCPNGVHTNPDGTTSCN